MRNLLISLSFIMYLWLMLVSVVCSVLGIWVYQVVWLMIDWFDLPELTSFITGFGSFYETDSLSLSSSLIDDWWLIWSSWTNIIHNKGSIILFRRQLDYAKFDYKNWLIDLIFLNLHHSLQDINHSFTQEVWL